MARYLSYKNIDNNKEWFKFHTTDASKNWWQNIEPDLNFITLTEDEFIKCKYRYPFILEANNQITIAEAPDGINQFPIEITKEEAEEALEKHISAMEHHVNNHETPLFTQNDVNTLKNININNISWPVSTNYGSWVESLEKNSITVDFETEI